MQVYLVGGAVRDKLLGLTPREFDWVVVGATPEEMLTQGYRQVGKDFPVFLHPETQDEYALARTERKTGKGYKGFDVYAAPDVTLEDDLLRRDLTINAIAQTPDGKLVDPYGGADDIKNRVLRHVSPAFAEDPLRVLRLARFYARFKHRGFTIAPETQKLLLKMVRDGELADLVPDRVWLEVEKVLACSEPQYFFEVLRECGALRVLFPELDALYGVPNTVKWHPEIDSGVHTLMVLASAAQLTDDKAVRFAALVHDFGKAVTPPEILPGHHGHDEAGVALIEGFCQRYPVPKEFRDLAVLVSRYHILCHQCEEVKAKTLLKIFNGIDAFRRPQRLTQLLIACEADSRGRTGHENEVYVQKAFLEQAFAACADVDVQAIIKDGAKGEQIREAVQLERLNRLKAFLKATSP